MAQSTSSSILQLPLDSRVAIVTDSSPSIGCGIATHLDSLGARVTINYASNLTQADFRASQLNSTERVRT
ncbi:unnamed protein product [Linum trigynum]|uniref:Uncharacterized protein n=1 Tax=Linum trigynum TaxID=586398 RepID=A0AAV2CSD2_9ROSI